MRYSSIQGITNSLYSSRYNKPILVDTSRNLWPRIQPAEIIFPVIVGISSLSLWLCAYFLGKEFSWTIYKSVHGSLQTRKRYRAYEVLYLLHYSLTGIFNLSSDLPYEYRYTLS